MSSDTPWGPSEPEGSDVQPPEPEEDRLEPMLPGGKGRKPFTKRQRTVLAVTLGACVVAVVVGTVLVATTSGDAPAPRAVTVSVADQNAPPKLIRAAEALGYQPGSQPGVGRVEDQPAETAPPMQAATLLAVGTKAPPFTLKTPAGETISLSDYRGKALLLELFATWCPHCAAEAPHLAKLANALPKEQYAFLSINGNNEDAATVFAYHTYFGLPFPSLLDPDPEHESVSYPDQGSPGPVTRSYRIGYYPTFYVIDPQGRITWRGDGEQPDELLQQELARAAGAS